ncbi:MarR family winged helix-turn-helix transcriptional regulator [Pseudalkalibacillus decolorationis]|uniref:MarR family winged helix-turn-helix transcriptional regulator n=1 Tax=Pseudalkalibacillus decolorationis TaxID=163879 RepID=UPI0021489981|nr:MarR family transcriptional regulator [Pseudalkalibacillus decolorationis]
MEYEPLDNIGVLIHTVDLEITSYVNSQLAAFQLTSEQNLIMALLWKHEGISQNEIATKLKKDKAGVTRMIFTLEKKGYIRRETCPNDKRSVKVYLTEDGRKLGNDVIPNNKSIIQLISKGMTKEEILELRRLLMKVRENVGRS